MCDFREVRLDNFNIILGGFSQFITILQYRIYLLYSWEREKWQHLSIYSSPKRLLKVAGYARLVWLRPIFVPCWCLVHLVVNPSNLWPCPQKHQYAKNVQRGADQVYIIVYIISSIAEERMGRGATNCNKKDGLRESIRLFVRGRTWFTFSLLGVPRDSQRVY